MEPAEPAGRGAGLRRGVPSARVCGRLKGERPSPSPRGEKRGTRTRGGRRTKSPSQLVPFCHLFFLTPHKKKEGICRFGNCCPLEPVKHGPLTTGANKSQPGEEANSSG